MFERHNRNKLMFRINSIIIHSNLKLTANDHTEQYITVLIT